MGKQFKPFLAPNDLLTVEEANKLNPDDYFIQRKIDGLRGTTIGSGIKTRSLKEFPNRALPENLSGLIERGLELGIYLDGEFDSESTSFNELSGILRSFDKPLPDDLVFKVFDHYDPSLPDLGGEERHSILEDYCKGIPNVEVVENLPWPDSFEDLFEQVLLEGYEGLMVKHRTAPYKFGRATYKQGSIFKMKPYETFDSKVIGFVQATVVDPNAEKKTNELGRSETSRKKGDRIPIESCAALWVNHNGFELKVSLASLSHEKRKEVWDQREEIRGKYIEYKGMVIGSKDLPRHPMFVRPRPDKD